MFETSPLHGNPNLVYGVFDLLYSVAYGNDLLGFLRWDLDIKLFLDSHNNLEYIQRVCTQIVHKSGVHGDLICIHI